ncbi:hypothetical protein NPIL_578561 [Nephila pilipes]|uniref:Uncharacterized protein n=1 Tax=Nephila pilipes TaxID=299642 RepID=A0A8X6ND38_NEPPI|nr:hypothetical protein NPIL_578561 [Nephila pilipes]
MHLYNPFEKTANYKIQRNTLSEQKLDFSIANNNNSSPFKTELYLSKTPLTNCRLTLNRYRAFPTHSHIRETNHHGIVIARKWKLVVLENFSRRNFSDYYRLEAEVSMSLGEGSFVIITRGSPSRRNLLIAGGNETVAAARALLKIDFVNNEEVLESRVSLLQYRSSFSRLYRVSAGYQP